MHHKLNLKTDSRSDVQISTKFCFLCHAV